MGGGIRPSFAKASDGKPTHFAKAMASPHTSLKLWQAHTLRQGFGWQAHTLR